MKTVMFCLLILNFTLFPSLSSASHNNSMSIDGREIKLGATVNEVRSKFSGGNSYILANDGPTLMGIFPHLSDANPRWVGRIEFENGRVKSVSKQWKDYSVEVSRLKPLLLGFISYMTQNGYEVALISTDAVRQPTYSADVILLTMNNKKAKICIQYHSDVSNRIAVIVDEVLSK